MLRPEKMCRVSVTGSKRVMESVVESVHDLDMLHVTEYDGAWDGFEPGDPVAQRFAVGNAGLLAHHRRHGVANETKE